MHSKLILFDIDYTLFDAQKYRVLRNQNISKHFNLDLEQVKIAGDDYAESIGHRLNFTASGHADYLGERFGIHGTEILNFVFSEPSHFKEALYPDVIPAFKDLKQRGLILGIFSEGHIENQQNKLKHTGVLEFLDSSQIYLFERKMRPENLAQIPKEALIVDDNQEIVSELSDLNYYATAINRSVGDTLLSINYKLA